MEGDKLFCKLKHLMQNVKLVNEQNVNTSFFALQLIFKKRKKEKKKEKKLVIISLQKEASTN